MRHGLFGLLVAALPVPLMVTASSLALGQDAPPAPPPGGGAEAGGDVPSGPNVTVVQVPGGGGAPTGGAAAAPDINSYLRSTNRPTSSMDSGTSFDFGGGAKGAVLRGSGTSGYVVSGQFAPEVHTASRGDTLWDISGRYFGNPYNWPRIWSYNKQIQNPHWIYPGDHIRLRGAYVQQVGFGVGFSGLKPLVSPDTHFVRYQGFVLDSKHPTWGEVVGSPEDQMLLSHGDEVYLQLEGTREYQVGQKLLVFEPRQVRNMSPDPLVWIRGIVQIDRYNGKTKMARARVIEALDTIERGAKVGPYERKVDPVAPVRNSKDIYGHIIGALYPHEFYGQNQIVFIDKGKDDGVAVGNRFFVVTRGDEWRLGLKDAGNAADKRAITEDDRMGVVESTPDDGNPELYPGETYAELLVMRVRKHTASCLVSASVREIPRGATVVARQGY